MKSIMLNLGTAFLSAEDATEVCDEILSTPTTHLTVALDGPPGAGKSTLTEVIQRNLRSRFRGIKVTGFGTDLDLTPRTERAPNSNLIDWYGQDIIRELLTHPGAQFDIKAYDLYTHGKTRNIRVSNPQSGIIVVEGIRSIEYAREWAKGQVVAVYFDVDDETRERRRMERNIATGRWGAHEAEACSKKQSGPVKDYFSDVKRNLQQSSHGNAKNELLFYSLTP